MRAKTIAAVLASAALVALALPGGAVAKLGHYKVPGSTYEAIQLRGTHGYRLQLTVFDRRARLSVDRQITHQGIVSVSYDVRRRLPAGSDIRFGLGKEGEVDLRFVPDRTIKTESPNCTGGAEVAEKGHFIGTIRFRGRGDFTHVEAHRARGVVTRTPPLRCHREKTPGDLLTVGIGTKSSPGVPKGTLELIAGTPDRKLQFTGYRFEEPLAGTTPPTSGSFTAWIERRGPGFTSTSIALGGGPPKSFVSPEPGEPLSAAAVSPSAPFSGSATFQMTSAKHGEWSGDLAVELPGYGRVPLTGPKIAAGLCETEACTPTLPKSLRPKTGPPAKKDGTAGEFTGNFFSE